MAKDLLGWIGREVFPLPRHFVVACTLPTIAGGLFTGMLEARDGWSAHCLAPLAFAVAACLAMALAARITFVTGALGFGPIPIRLVITDLDGKRVGYLEMVKPTD